MIWNTIDEIASDFDISKEDVLYLARRQGWRRMKTLEETLYSAADALKGVNSEGSTK